MLDSFRGDPVMGAEYTEPAYEYAEVRLVADPLRERVRGGIVELGTNNFPAPALAMSGTLPLDDNGDLGI
jgi:hypothetical protein